MEQPLPSKNDGKLGEPLLGKDVEMSKFIEGNTEVPVDKRNIVYWIILLHGIGVLMPWNMFINIAHTYYVNYKMQTHTYSPNGTALTEPTYYSENFQFWLTICAQVPNLLLNLINIFVTNKGDLTHRIAVSLAIVGGVVAITNAFVFVDTFDWIQGFFYLTMISVIVLNGANGVYQNSIYGMVSDFPFQFTNAVMIGNNFCGTFVAVVSIIAGFLTQSETLRAFGYFSVSLITLAACFVSFFVLRKQPFYQYYTIQGNLNREKEASTNGPPKFTDYFETFKQGWVQFANVYIVFFVTLTIFPNIMVFTTPNLAGEKYNFWISKDQFTNIFCFLLFNVFAWVGSMAAGIKQFPGPDHLWIVCWARVLLVPFFMYCNYLPISHIRTAPVLFPNVYLYILMAIVMSISSGYLSSLSMMYAPRVVDASKGCVAGMMAAFFLILGVVTGLIFSGVVEYLV